MRYLDWFLRLALAAVFVGAAIPKIADPAEFHAAILTYRMLPEALTPVLALWLPWVELCAGFAVFLPRHRRAAAWLLLAMATIFIGAIGQAWWRDLDIVCGCFGRPATVRGSGYLKYLARDFVFLALAASVLLRERALATHQPRPTAQGF